MADVALPTPAPPVDSDELNAVTDPLLTVGTLLIVLSGVETLFFHWLLTALAYLSILQVFNASFAFLSSLVKCLTSSLQPDCTDLLFEWSVVNLLLRNELAKPVGLSGLALDNWLRLTLRDKNLFFLCCPSFSSRTTDEP